MERDKSLDSASFFDEILEERRKDNFYGEDNSNFQALSIIDENYYIDLSHA